MLSEIYMQDPSAKAYKHDIPWALFLSFSRNNRSLTQKLRITSIAITTVKVPVETVHFVKAHLSQMKILSSKRKELSEDTNIDVVILRKKTGGLRLQNLSPSFSRSIRM
jgi:hypothetical protein